LVTKKGQKLNSQASLSMLPEIQVELEGPGDLQARVSHHGRFWGRD